MGSNYSLSESVTNMPKNQAQFEGYHQMYWSAKEVIQTVYPNAKVNGKPSKKSTGEFEVTITKANGDKKLVYSKLRGDGAFSGEKAQLHLLKVLEEFIRD